VTEEPGQAGLEDSLREVDAELAELRRTARGLREQVGEDEPGDYADRSAAIEAADEQDEIIAQLEDRRSDLLRRLGRPQ
jgi:hypothetical protein